MKKRLRSSDDLDFYNDDGEPPNSDRSGSSSYHRSFSSNNFSRIDRGGFPRRRSNREFDNNNHHHHHHHQPSRYHRSSRRDFPKGFRSEREASVSSSWRRFGGGDFGFEDRRLREPDRERSLRSPSWSRDDQSKSKQVDSRRSRSKPLASPTWSKDSGSEQSISAVKRKEEHVQGSEMEEGELEPETKDDDADDDNNSTKQPDDDDHKKSRIDSSSFQEMEKNADFDTETESIREVSHVGGDDKVSVEEGENVAEHETETMHVSENDISTALASEHEPSSPTPATASGNEITDTVDDKGAEYKKNPEVKLEESLSPDVPERFQVEELKGVESNDDANKAETEALSECVEENAPGDRTPVEYISIVSDNSNHKGKDKGESSDAPVTRLLGNSLFSERKSEDPTDKDKDEKDDNFECPSMRGFELFSTSPVRRTNKTEQSGFTKPKDEKLLLEPLALSLSLPDVLLPIGGQDTNQPLGSPVRSGSVRSLTDTFCTNSDGVTMSMSFSGSRSFNHNPSCSLTHNIGDNEQSVHSRPIFQGIDWQALSQNDPKYNESTVYQRLMENGNGSVQPQAMKGILTSGQANEDHLRLPEGSSKVANSLEKQLSFQKSLDVRSACPGMGSLENGSKLNVEKKKGKDFFSGSNTGITGLEAGGHNFVETVISYILSDSMHVMTKRFHEMPTRNINSLMDNIRQMMLNMDKNVQRGAFQDALQNRTDITLELLAKSHRAQLEILVALKTGRPDFLQSDKSILSSHLVEIYMNMRCRNLSCRALVPVDECDCKICSRKDGFCSACMCLVCSNFDMASNTCSWVGCDVCLHWCHTDCAIGDSYVRNGINASGAPGMTEMQFHCVACNHPSEMFGFVKEVFLNFAREWKFDRFCKELEYVNKIFSSSKDFRGKQLRQATDAMLARLKSKSIDLAEACNRILGFISDCDSSTPGETLAPLRYEQPNQRHERGSASQDISWLRSVCSDKPHHQLKRSVSVVDAYNRERQAEICGVDIGLKRGSPKEPRFEELESIVKMKLAEAEMFQGRADDARREAEGLKRIAIAKKEKVEDEYKRRVGKLNVVEAEERRRRKHEELEALERGRREFYEMKMRMDEEMRGLLTKMEVTKQSLAL